MKIILKAPNDVTVHLLTDGQEFEETSAIVG